MPRARAASVESISSETSEKSEPSHGLNRSRNGPSPSPDSSKVVKRHRLSSGSDMGRSSTDKRSNKTSGVRTSTWNGEAHGRESRPDVDNELGMCGPVSIGARRKRARALKIRMFEKASPFAAYMDATELEQLAAACSIVKFKPSSKLRESPFYLVITGCITVLQPGGRVLVKRHEGSFFTRGMAEGLENDDTILVGHKAGKVLLVRSVERLLTFLERCSAHARDAYETVVSTNLATVLSSVPFIKEAQMESNSLRSLSELCSYLTLPPNSYVFQQGDEADRFYIVLKGQTPTLTLTYHLSLPTPHSPLLTSHSPLLQTRNP